MVFNIYSPGPQLFQSFDDPTDVSVCIEAVVSKNSSSSFSLQEIYHYLATEAKNHQCFGSSCTKAQRVSQIERKLMALPNDRFDAIVKAVEVLVESEDIPNQKDPRQIAADGSRLFENIRGATDSSVKKVDRI